MSELLFERLKTLDEFLAYIRSKLGEPKIRVELANSIMQANLSDAINFYREYAAQNGSFRSYLTVDIFPGTVEYTLPNNIIQVVRVGRGPHANSSAWVLATMSGAMASDALALKSFDMVSYTMLNHWLNTLRIITRSPFRVLYNNNRKLLRIVPNPRNEERIFLEVYAEEDYKYLLNEQFIREYTLALCKISLGEIRQKFENLPGFGGNVTLNGADLVTDGKDEKKILEDDLIISFKYSRPPLPVFHIKN